MMKAIFKRLPFPVKLSIVGLLPLLCLIVLAVQFLSEKKQRLEIVNGYATQLERSALIAALIDKLQAERRYAFGYVINGRWANEMVMERERTDEAKQKLLEASAKTLRGFESYSMLTDIEGFRVNVSRRSVSPEQVMDFYTGIILRLNTLSYLSSDNIPFLQGLNEDLRGQRILSHMITYLGIVRSKLYYDFLTGRELKYSADAIRSDFSTYSALEKELLAKGSATALIRFEDVYKNSNLRTTVESIREVVSRNQSLYAGDADGWWDLSASAVDALKSIQREVLSNVQTGAAQIYENERKDLRNNLIAIIGIVILVVFMIFYSIKNISDTLNELRILAQQLARGAPGIVLDIRTRDVIADLGQAIMEIDDSNLQLSAAASQIGQGNFEVEVAPRSDEDVLGNAVLTMKNDLQKFSEENRVKIWLQSGENFIGESLRGEKDVAVLAEDALSALASYLGAQTGLFYAVDRNSLRFCAAYAIKEKHSIRKEIASGETLIGAVARSRQTMLVNDLPDEFLKISSGHGEVIPRHLVIFPLIHNDRLEGVIELASIKPFVREAQEFIEMVAPALAISLQSAQSRARLQELLEETQAQAEELQTQHSELENLNAELEAQAQKLQASEEELRVQQEELQQTNEELEERSSLLVEKNMEVQKKAEELEQSTKYKSEFLANMSHELRTPLNSILLLSRLLFENNEKNLNDEEVEYARVIQNSGQGLLSLIDEILDLSKIEAGKMQVEFIDVSLSALSDEINSLFQPVAKEKGLEFQVRIQEGLPEKIISDKVRLGQIIKNLLSNALKFTSKGSVVLSIAKHPKKAEWLQFSVKDTGIGIPKEKQKQIFEAFQQADGSTKRKFGGTGLGLSISRELGKLLGGDIEVKSDPGKGSEFVLSLPENPDTTRDKDKDEETHSEYSSKTITEQENGSDAFVVKEVPEGPEDDRKIISKSDKSILIIEDDTPFAKALLDFTRKKGYKGLVAVRGDEGIDLARRFKPLGILLDIQLPVKSGWQVMDELKSDPGTRHIPVHMMSSLKMKKESLMKGAVDFIDKPVALQGMQEMFKKIEFVLSRESKKVLIIEDNAQHAKALAYFLETFNINSELRKDVGEGLETLKSNEGVDCVILDMGVPDQKTYNMLEAAKKDPKLEHVPIIIFTGKSLSKTEEMKIKKYADSIVVKTAHSYQRMLDEVSIFLHMVEENKKVSGVRHGVKKMGELAQVLDAKTVLVVDDDVRNIFSLSKTLEKYNMKVLTAIDGKEALEVMEQNPGLDVVLLDMMMPNLDGYETAKRIRNNPRWRQLPVIAVTAKAMVGDREKCIEAGASDYITKPVDIDQLVSLLRVWLYQHN